MPQLNGIQGKWDIKVKVAFSHHEMLKKIPTFCGFSE